jgi:hypothetical protein
MSESERNRNSAVLMRRISVKFLHAALLCSLASATAHPPTRCSSWREELPRALEELALQSELLGLLQQPEHVRLQRGEALLNLVRKRLLLEGDVEGAL